MTQQGFMALPSNDRKPDPAPDVGQKASIGYRDASAGLADAAGQTAGLDAADVARVRFLRLAHAAPSQSLRGPPVPIVHRGHRYLRQLHQHASAAPARRDVLPRRPQHQDRTAADLPARSLADRYDAVARADDLRPAVRLPDHICVHGAEPLPADGAAVFALAVVPDARQPPDGQYERGFRPSAGRRVRDVHARRRLVVFNDCVSQSPVR
jgi:hypothetical protein